MKNVNKSKTEMEEFIDKYLTRGFGSMNKNDFEVEIMHWLLQNRLNGKSNYEISRKLRIPESKVKRLIYEASLKYERSEKELLENFIECLLCAQELKEGDKIKFIIEDVATRRFLDGKLKENYLLSDTSWNSETVVITPFSLAKVLEFLLESNNDLNVKDKINKVKNKLKNERLFNALKELLNGLTKECASTAIDSFVDALKNKNDKIN